MKVAIVKYNAGNIRSVINAVRRLGIDPIYTDDADILRQADRVIFPGQGEASTAMAYLREHGLVEVISSLRQPVLGICIGQQLLCRHSEEGDTECMGIFRTDVKRFQPERHEDKVPVMGWNAIKNLRSPLFNGLADDDYVYFVHSYYCPICEDTIAESHHILNYSAALHRENFYATQFHPEKSGDVGEQILKNFLTLN
ncbi:MAG: imidazole glycerol phosphate synthase subunit HisH [Prevotella sp.]|nr:imidazole glycerol phosphate synthase subunit HisH [Prevotella sp.]MBR6495477.1 imidazole glycerol phosphate synthase subunit HisH [Prevotella sp.]